MLSAQHLQLTPSSCVKVLEQKLLFEEQDFHFKFQ